MSLALLDTDVMVEVQRGRPGAQSWLAALTDDIALPAPLAWEILIGSRHRVELRRSQRFLSRFGVVEVDAEDSSLARTLIEGHCLTSGMSLSDFVIAAQALTRSATLYTFNVRHYQVIPGLDVRIPYTRMVEDQG